MLVQGAVSGAARLNLNASNTSNTGVVDLQAASINDLDSLSIDADSVSLSAAGSVNTIRTRNNLDLVLHSSTPALIDGNLSSTTGSVSLSTLNSELVMAGNTAITAQAGDVTLSADNGDIRVSQLSAANGTIGLSAKNGRIADNNGTATNLSASRVTINAASGVDVDTSTGILDIQNGSGNVVIDNNRAVQVNNLVNSGNITFKNIGTVTVDNIDAGYTTGNLNMLVTNGSIYGLGKERSIPDITANSAFIFTDGDFGTYARRMYLYINQSFTLFANLSSAHYYRQRPPVVNDQSTIKVDLQDAMNNLSGQQMIEVESLGDIDPAVFTEVRNYNQDATAIKMPEDQLFE